MRSVLKHNGIPGRPRPPTRTQFVRPAPGGGIRAPRPGCVTRIWASSGSARILPHGMQDPKEVAGREAAGLVEDGMRVGLGTGSTVHFTIHRLAERMREEGLRLRCVPTSVDTEHKARSLGIPLVGLDEVDEMDMTIDGADEIDGRFDMIKGGGGARLREKVFASISRREALLV